MKVQAQTTLNAVDLKTLNFQFISDALAGAVDHAGKDLVGAIKSFCPVLSGTLRDSIDYTVRYYRDSGKVVLIAGPKRRYRKKGNFPVKYAHLVEFGHVSVKPVRGSTVRAKKRNNISAKKITFVPAHPFMRPGTEAFKSFAGSRFGSDVEKSMSVKIRGLPKRKKEIK